jgi:hypothetical protein
MTPGVGGLVLGGLVLGDVVTVGSVGARGHGFSGTTVPFGPASGV